MGRKLGLDLGQVVAAAKEVADSEGLDALSLASVSSALGVRSPSLYTHVDGLDGLRRELTLHAARLLTDELSDATEGLRGTEALTAIAEQLRSFAHRHPGLYGTFLPAPTSTEDPDVASALEAPVKVVGSVMADMDINPKHVISLIRALRSAVHGFIDLELRSGFGLSDDIDESFTTTINLVIDTISVHTSNG